MDFLILLSSGTDIQDVLNTSWVAQNSSPINFTNWNKYVLRIYLMKQ